MKNKRWIEESGDYVLFFTPFYEEERIATIIFDAEDDGSWRYCSGLLNADMDCLNSDTIEEAKEEVESLVANQYESEKNYYQEVFDRFTEV
jgi:hypothetical protein